MSYSSQTFEWQFIYKFIYDNICYIISYTFTYVHTGSSQKGGDDSLGAWLLGGGGYVRSMGARDCDFKLGPHT